MSLYCISVCTLMFRYQIGCLGCFPGYVGAAVRCSSVVIHETPCLGLTPPLVETDWVMHSWDYAALALNIFVYMFVYIYLGLLCFVFTLFLSYILYVDFAVYLLWRPCCSEEEEKDYIRQIYCINEVFCTEGRKRQQTHTEWSFLWTTDPFCSKLFFLSQRKNKRHSAFLEAVTKGCT